MIFETFQSVDLHQSKLNSGIAQLNLSNRVIEVMSLKLSTTRKVHKRLAIVQHVVMNLYNTKPVHGHDFHNHK